MNWTPYFIYGYIYYSQYLLISFSYLYEAKALKNSHPVTNSRGGRRCRVCANQGKFNNLSQLLLDYI